MRLRGYKIGMQGLGFKACYPNSLVTKHPGGLMNQGLTKVVAELDL